MRMVGGFLLFLAVAMVCPARAWADAGTEPAAAEKRDAPRVYTLQEALAALRRGNPEEIRQIKTVNIGDEPLSDLNLLSKLPLESLDLNGCKEITDFSPLAGLTGLKGLYLSDTRIKDLSPLAKLPLESLELFSLVCVLQVSWLPVYSAVCFLSIFSRESAIRRSRWGTGARS